MTCARPGIRPLIFEDGARRTATLHMRTPSGRECKYFYGDYYRGRRREECALLKAGAERWSADLCRTCPVPALTQANACEFLQLNAHVVRPLAAAFQRRVAVSAFCQKSLRAVPEPQIGCGECHALPSEFQVHN
jgi:hypothetical protein